MATFTTLSRRRWARRGRGLADFGFSFVVAGLSHVLGAGAQLVRWLYRAAIAVPLRVRKVRAGAAAVGSNSLPATGTPEIEPPGPAFAPIASKPDVRFEDVAGLEEAKRDIRLRMILPLQHPDEARALRIRRGGGLLLYGPPGTGKTLLAKAVASELDCPFYHVRPSDVMSGEVGEAERNVKQLFATVRSHPRAVLFLDEVEALIPSRRRNGSTIMARVISQFLSEVDGLDATTSGSSLLLIGATNEPDMLDPAMHRPGRFDTKVYVGPPNPAARKHILLACLRDRPTASDVSIDAIVASTDQRTGAEICSIVQQAADSAFLRSLQTREPPMIRPVDFGVTDASSAAPARAARPAD